MPRRSQTTSAAPELAPELDPGFVQATNAAAEEREQAWSEEHSWQGQALHPWSMGREMLLVRLIESDVPAAELEQIPLISERIEKAGGVLKLEEVVEVGLYLPVAAKVLFLATHEPEQWDHLRGRDVSRFLRVIETWAEEEGIPSGEEWPAVHTALALRADYRKMRALRRPGRSVGRDSGN
jgi:hypothetical protein